VIQEPGAVFEAIYESGQAGLAGNLAVAIHDNQSNVVFGPTTLQIVELIVDGEPTGTYRAMLTAPAVVGQYSINWSNDGSFDPLAGGAEEDLEVANISLNLPSLGAEVGSVLCSAWTTSDDVLTCCSATIGSDTTRLDASIAAASELLYEASGRRFAGVCERTVRPCRIDSCLCGVQGLSRGHLVGWDGACWGGCDCGCQPQSRVKLAGYVREVTEVKIDGIVIDPDEYFVQGHRWLVHRDPGRWPSCQVMDRTDDEEGTCSVTYEYGKAPRVAGQLAAAELACEILKACTPDAECALPSGVVRITRQNITLERSFFVRNADGVWATGIGSVDFFLNTFNPSGIKRRGTVWSPSSSGRYARPNAA